jgi:hypothetical protein
VVPPSPFDSSQHEVAGTAHVVVPHEIVPGVHSLPPSGGVHAVPASVPVSGCISVPLSVVPPEELVLEQWASRMQEQTVASDVHKAKMRFI